MRRLSRTLTTMVVVLGILAVGSGCVASRDSGAQPAQSSSYGAPVDQTPRTDLTNEQAVEWTRYEVVTDHELRIFFTSGDPKCYGSRAVVTENGSSVNVEVIEGTVPGAPSLCTAVASLVSIIVKTDDPIGNRTVLPLTSTQSKTP